MPIYEYRCPQCGEKFEKLVRFGGDAQVRCPRCDSESPQRMISLVAQSVSSFCSTSSYAPSSCTTPT